jgi:two-component system LytT family sensor kinase
LWPGAGCQYYPSVRTRSDYAKSRANAICAGSLGARISFFTGVLLVGNIGDHKPPTFALYANAVHFALWTLLLPFLVSCARWFPLEGPNRLRNGAALLTIVAVLAVPVMATQWAILFFTYFPYHSADLTLWSFLKSESGRFLPVDVLIGIVLVVALEGLRIWHSLQTERTRAAELERQLAVSRLDALRMQLHPHFLFNTLHTIAGLIVEQPPSARRMVIALGELLRLTLEDTGRPLRSLAEELEFADLYLGIEKLRLGERLVIDYDIEPEATRAEGPQLLLQPLFENAIRHGATRITGVCEVRFRAYREREWLRLMISNDGPPHLRTLKSSRSGVGLTNTKDRLRLHYKDSFTFQYSDRPQGGVQIEISIPYKSTEKKSGKAGSTLRREGFEDSEIDFVSEKIPADHHIVHQLE